MKNKVHIIAKFSRQNLAIVSNFNLKNKKKLLTVRLFKNEILQKWGHDARSKLRLTRLLSTINYRMSKIIFLIQIQPSTSSHVDWRFLNLLLNHYKSPKCIRMFLFSRLRQRVHGGCDRSADDSSSSVEPDPTSILFFRGPCFLSSCLVLFPLNLILNTVH